MIKAQLEGAGGKKCIIHKVVLYSKGTTAEYKISLHRSCSHLRELQNHPSHLKNHSKAKLVLHIGLHTRQDKKPKKKKNLKKGKGKEKKRECEREGKGKGK